MEPPEDCLMNAQCLSWDCLGAALQPTWLRPVAAQDATQRQLALEEPALRMLPSASWGYCCLTKAVARPCSVSMGGSQHLRQLGGWSSQAGPRSPELVNLKAAPNLPEGQGTDVQGPLVSPDVGGASRSVSQHPLQQLRLTEAHVAAPRWEERVLRSHEGDGGDQKQGANKGKGWEPSEETASALDTGGPAELLGNSRDSMGQRRCDASHASMDALRGCRPLCDAAGGRLVAL
ncbi:hypothetical protein P7K49_012195 [Saguinus oedipus]|uniref:Uncharacterized protein n=1 Tax=Saguinus oedipus TaxID=9490 RepID=A0ABQ9VV62_SAGOE|nr:hypothetical protein P7K49_012195 [Saguinus oedipus]